MPDDYGFGGAIEGLTRLAGCLAIFALLSLPFWLYAAFRAFKWMCDHIYIQW